MTADHDEDDKGDGNSSKSGNSCGFMMIVMMLTLVMEMDQKMLLIRMVNPMAVILALLVTMNTKGCQG